MTPAGYPLELVIRIRGPRDSYGGPVYEEHPVVGWDKDGNPFVLHWRTGQAVGLDAFLDLRGRDNVHSYGFRSALLGVNTRSPETQNAMKPIRTPH